jgi:hypothetical protein
MAAVGLVAVAVGVNRFRAAVESADEAARVAAIPAPLRSVLVYRVAAIIVVVGGLLFIFIATAAP